MLIKNPMQLQIELNARVSIALENTMKVLLDELRNIIEKEVYSYPETWGGRTGEFKDSWSFSSPTIVGDLVQSLISQNGFSFSYDGSSWVHGNPWSPIDINILNNVIENGLTDSHFGFPAIGSRPFWGNFKMWLDINLDLVWMQQCKVVGLNLQPITSTFL